MPKQWVLMTNDDGVESESLLGLGKALADQDLGVVIFAPSDNQSATGMKLNLMKPLPFTHRVDLEEEWFSNSDFVHVYSLDGSPCDTVKLECRHWCAAGQLTLLVVTDHR